MARLTETDIKTNAFVDKEYLFTAGVVFCITGAELRHDPPPFGDNVVFQISSGADVGQFSMSANDVRLQYVKHFAQGGGVIENMELFKIPSTKGNPAWGMRDAGDEKFKANTFLPLYDTNAPQLGSGDGDANPRDIPF